VAVAVSDPFTATLMFSYAGIHSRPLHIVPCPLQWLLLGLVSLWLTWQEVVLLWERQLFSFC